MNRGHYITNPNNALLRVNQYQTTINLALFDTLKMGKFMTCAEYRQVIQPLCEVKSLSGRVVAVAAGAAGADLWMLEGSNA